MLAGDSWIPTIQLAIATAGTVATAWIAVLQIRARAKLAEATRKIDAAACRQDEALTKLSDLETQINDAETARFHPQKIRSPE